MLNGIGHRAFSSRLSFATKKNHVTMSVKMHVKSQMLWRHENVLQNVNHYYTIYTWSHRVSRFSNNLCIHISNHLDPLTRPRFSFPSRCFTQDYRCTRTYDANGNRTWIELLMTGVRSPIPCLYRDGVRLLTVIVCIIMWWSLDSKISKKINEKQMKTESRFGV